jgi:hypothetical protein
MRTTLSLVLVIAALSGCAMDDSPDGIDEVGVVPGGKADGSDFTACELDAVVAWLNEGPGADAIRSAGVHSRAAGNLVEHRDGADATFGTADDDLFDDIGEVDDVYYVETSQKAPVWGGSLTATTARSALGRWTRSRRGAGQPSAGMPAVAWGMGATRRGGIDTRIAL